MANRDNEGMPKWKRWALEGVGLSMVPGFLRGLGPTLSPSERAAHDVFRPYNAEFNAWRSSSNPLAAHVKGKLSGLVAQITHTGSAEESAAVGRATYYSSIGKGLTSGFRGLPWGAMANPGNLYNQALFGPLPRGLMGKLGHGAGQLVRYGPQMATGVVTDLLRGGLRDFGIAGAPKANSLLINVARAGVIARALAPIPGALYRAQVGPATEMENPQLTRSARATNAQKRLEASVAGLSLSLGDLRGRAVLP